MDDAGLQPALDRLTEADILLVQGVAPQSEYRFKHALIQDAAYENLLKSRRQFLHRRMGEVLRDQFAARAVAERPQPSQLAILRAGDRIEHAGFCCIDHESTAASNQS
jgi:hypothetical protein